MFISSFFSGWVECWWLSGVGTWHQCIIGERPISVGSCSTYVPSANPIPICIHVHSFLCFSRRECQLSHEQHSLRSLNFVCAIQYFSWSRVVLHGTTTKVNESIECSHIRAVHAQPFKIDEPAPGMCVSWIIQSGAVFVFKWPKNTSFNYKYMNNGEGV